MIPGDGQERGGRAADSREGGGITSSGVRGGKTDGGREGNGTASEGTRGGRAPGDSHEGGGIAEGGQPTDGVEGHGIIGGSNVPMTVKQISDDKVEITGGAGWHSSGKITVTIEGNGSFGVGNKAGNGGGAVSGGISENPSGGTGGNGKITIQGGTSSGVGNGKIVVTIEGGSSTEVGGG